MQDISSRKTALTQIRCIQASQLSFRGATQIRQPLRHSITQQQDAKLAQGVLQNAVYVVMWFYSGTPPPNVGGELTQGEK